MRPEEEEEKEKERVGNEEEAEEGVDKGKRESDESDKERSE